MKKASVVIILTLIAFSLASAASLDPRHPLSNIHPTDTDFNMSGYQVFNASAFELQDGLNLSGYSVYDQGGVKILGWDENNGKWDFLNSDIEIRDGNIQMNGNNITEIDTLHFLTGMKINGSISMSGGDIELDNGSIRNVYSIDGGGDAVNFFDAVDFSGNSIKDSQGALTFDTRLYIPNNELDMAGNNIINPGKVDGVDLDFPGNGLGITNSRYNIITDAIGDSELNNSQEFTMQGLDVSGGNITNIDTLKFVEGTSIDGDIEINGSIDTTGGIDLNNEDIDDVRSIDGGGDSVSFDDSIDLNGNDLVEPNQIRTGGQNIQIRDTSNGQDVARFQEGGNIEIPNGNLDLQGNSLVDATSSNQVTVGDASDDQVVLAARNGVSAEDDLNMNSNNITNFFENACASGEAVAGVDDDGGYYCVDIANEVSDVYVNRSGDSMTGDLDMQGNDIYDVGSQGIGTATPQENLDVDGTASIENAGTRMEVDSSGNVVVTLGS